MPTTHDDERSIRQLRRAKNDRCGRTSTKKSSYAQGKS